MIDPELDWPVLSGIDPDRLRRLHDRLADSADRAGLLDIAYRIVDSPVGTLLLAGTSQGLLRVAFALEHHDQVLADLAARVSPRILQARRRLDPVAAQLDDYFAGRRTRFALPLDLRLSRGFRREVLLHLDTVAYGRTQTYAEVAVATGHPRAVRAVGTSCATNPLPIVVPCHRVVRSNGTLGGYLGGLPAKAALLRLEQTPTR